MSATKLRSVGLDEVQRLMLADALVLYAVDTADFDHMYESDPADCTEAPIVAAKLGILDEFVAAFTEYRLRREDDRREQAEDAAEFEKRIQWACTEGVANARSHGDVP